MKGMDIMRRRMHNSGLIGERFGSAPEVVAWHGAMQAQDYGPAKWSIGQRADGVIDADVDRALASGEIVRTHVLRPTWHFVQRDDLRWMLALTGPRVLRGKASRFRELELDARELARCEKTIVAALEGGNKLTRDGIGAALDASGIDSSGQRLPWILTHCEMTALICSGGLEGKKHTYALVDERIPPDRRFDRDEASIELTRRYLKSHGPAVVHDFRWWSGLTIADIRKALDALGDEVSSESREDFEFWSVAGTEQAPANRGAALLQTYDELIVGYTGSRYVGDDRAGAARTAWMERRLPGVVLINGGIAGHWKRTFNKASVVIEVVTYDDPKPTHIRALRSVATELGRFVGREATIEVSRL